MHRNQCTQIAKKENLGKNQNKKANSLPTKSMSQKTKVIQLNVQHHSSSIK